MKLTNFALLGAILGHLASAAPMLARSADAVELLTPRSATNRGQADDPSVNNRHEGPTTDINNSECGGPDTYSPVYC
ncbi:hypothetical protein EG329_012882 [Mollisiaceae sp. DMI_Dod_QoI]|nr:hypothetical protein EG329_012882 [Helotiales sp. DMI_Dod_QoI]